MLTLQRASAGSGKTFTLARTYISLLISIRDDNGKYRLRTYHELAEPLRHILGVTFTNKATNEMKQRIIEKLADLATYPQRLKQAQASGTKLPKRPDYLDTFTQDLNATDEEVCERCHRALTLLLLHYSDFNISTIDSFFQSILRTFAYETDLNDAYQLEIDSTVVNSMGVDAMLDKVIHDSSPVYTKWVQLLMKSKLDTSFNTWNIFNRSTNDFSLYKDLLSHTRELDKENFKEIRTSLQKYFDRDVDLYAQYLKLDQLINEPIKTAYQEMGRRFILLKEAFDRAGLTFKEHGRGNLNSQYQKSISGDYAPSSPFSYTLGNSVFASKLKKKDLPANAQELENLHLEWYEAYLVWKDEISKPERSLWKEYLAHIPFVALLNDVQSNIRQYLDQSNTMMLGDTNSLLKRIISDSDTPFVYERMGTRIHNFLIDEFQDTSRLQWENFRPLIGESEGSDYQNLIIGDAKQSIYRFRNADPDIITTAVPARFPRHIPAGHTVKDNTNWRSQRNIVEFNNFLFHHFAHILDRRVSDDLQEDSSFFRNLYSNVVQHASHQEPLGYVNVKLYPHISSSANDSSDASSDDAAKPYYSEIGPLIHSCLDRGYKMRDIAILINTHKQADAVVKTLIDYNATLPPERSPIEFVSDESLKISASGAVSAILALMAVIASGIQIPEPVKEGTAENDPTNTDTATAAPQSQQHTPKIRYSDIRAGIDFYTCKYPDMTPDMRVNLVMSDPKSVAEILNDLLADMQVVSLPVLVEAIVSQFIAPDTRRRDAAYIAAFQDMVLAYSERNPSDINSFLKWWERQSDKAAITSPENVDAVSLMTIHKSKGLEFPVVIVPTAHMPLTPNQDRFLGWEWTSVDLPEEMSAQLDLPDYLPIRPVSALRDTSKGALRLKTEQHVMMDNLNKAYVAFTRAAAELYIFAESAYNPKKDYTVYNILDEVLQPESVMRQRPDVEISDTFSDSECGPEKNIRVIEYGQPLTPEDIQDIWGARNRKEADSAGTLHHITDYPVSEKCAIMEYRDGGIQEYSIADEVAMQEAAEAAAEAAMLDGEMPESPENEMPEEIDIDPRSEGNLMHGVLAQVERLSDLPLALLRLRISGIVPMPVMQHISDMLTQAVEEAPQEWFDTQARIMNERSLLRREWKQRRPDRMILAPDGTITVVDYKFGAPHPAHIRQVQGYMRTLQGMGKYKKVKGYLWYVKEHKIEEVFGYHRKNV